MLSIDQPEKMVDAQEVDKTTQMPLQQNVETSSMGVMQEDRSK